MKSYNNKRPLDYYEKLEKKEIEIYNELYFDDNDIKDIETIDKNNILSRKIVSFSDYDYNLPQNIFIIKHFRGKTIVGRKIRSVLRKNGKINAINCSMITAHMLLGFLSSRKKDKRKITIYYYPFTNEEKKYIFNILKDNRKYDIYYPYKYRDYDYNLEECSPEDGWTFNPEKKEYLGYGEVHLRDFTINFFKELNLNLKNKRIYDPACSTGEFLYTFKNSFPNCYTIGHDLSQQMVDYSKNYVDESCCCNAFDSPLKDNSVDIMFLRFLNSEVVTTPLAYAIFNVIKNKVRKGGLIVGFGHTPLLITKEYFIKQGLKPIICNGYDKRNNAIFQYYVFEVL